MKSYFILMVVILVFLILLFIKNNKKENKIFYLTDDYPITKVLEKYWKVIAYECNNLPKDVMITTKGRKQHSWHGSDNFQELADLHYEKHGWINGWQADSDVVNKEWINWGLVFDGKLLGKNSEMCPYTSFILSKIPGIRVAGFSIMKPKSKIHPHTDSTGIKYNSLAYHLGLDIPNDGECRLYVLNKSMLEENGKAFLFDATFKHHADNQSNNDRAILYIDFDLDAIS